MMARRQTKAFPRYHDEFSQHFQPSSKRLNQIVHMRTTDLLSYQYKIGDKAINFRSASSITKNLLNGRVLAIRGATRGIKQESFDFLGFTFFLSKSKNWFVIPKLKTSRKRLISKLKKATSWIKANRSRKSQPELWTIFCSKIRGHAVYYGASFNLKSISRFVFAAKHILFKWLNERGGRKLLDWSKFNLFIKRNPLPRIILNHKLF